MAAITQMTAWPKGYVVTRTPRHLPSYRSTLLLLFRIYLNIFNKTLQTTKILLCYAFRIAELQRGSTPARRDSCRLSVGFYFVHRGPHHSRCFCQLLGNFLFKAADQNLGLADYRVPKFKEICFKVTSDQGFILKQFPIIPEEGSRN